MEYVARIVNRVVIRTICETVDDIEMCKSIWRSTISEEYMGLGICRCIFIYTHGRSLVAAKLSLVSRCFKTNPFVLVKYRYINPFVKTNNWIRTAGLCLVLRKFCKISYIFHHIKLYDICLEH